jgi:protein-tyrosine phosphatase
MDADEVTWITGQIAITNFFSAHQSAVTAEHKIDAILCLDRELQGEPAEGRGIRSIEVVNLLDGPNDMAVFRRAVSALESLLESHKRVLVHCRAGRSRSIAVVAAYLKKSQGLDSQVALDFVQAKRQSALASELIRLVERFE